MAALIGLLMLPLLVCAVSPLQAGTGWLYLGLLPAATAAMTDRRAGLPVAAITAAGFALGILSSNSEQSAVLMMALVAGGVGFSARFGWSSFTSVIAVSVAVAVVSPPAFATAGGDFARPGTVLSALLVASFVLAGGLWAAAVLHVAMRGGPAPVTPVAHAGAGDREVSAYTGQLVVLVAIGTWLCVDLAPNSHAWWLLLTFFVVLAPTTEQSWSRLAQRVAGTVAGACVAASLILVIHSPVALRLIGVGFAALTVYANLTKPPWLFAAFLTVALILARFSDVGSGLASLAERTGLTIAGAAAAAVVLLVTQRLMRLSSTRYPADH